MNPDLSKQLLNKYLSDGEDKFYKAIIFSAINKLVVINREKYQGIYPNTELLSIHDHFLLLYRREGESVYLKIAKVFRKAAHKIYRVMLKKKMTALDDRFLNLV